MARDENADTIPAARLPHGANRGRLAYCLRNPAIGRQAARRNSEQRPPNFYLKRCATNQRSEFGWPLRITVEHLIATILGIEIVANQSSRSPILDEFLRLVGSRRILEGQMANSAVVPRHGATSKRALREAPLDPHPCPFGFEFAR